MKEFMVVKILWIQNKSKTGGMVHQMFSLVMQQGLSECIAWQDQTFALKETWNDAIKRENVDMVKNYKKNYSNFHVDVNKSYAEAPECTFNGERIVATIELHC